jgi:hypothetical protein
MRYTSSTAVAALRPLQSEGDPLVTEPQLLIGHGSFFKANMAEKARSNRSRIQGGDQHS